MALTLAELSQSIFSSLGVKSAANELNLTRNDFQRECLVLVDGLGKNAIDEFGASAEFVSEMNYQKTLTATFPSTTATSLTSLGTGLAPGLHGMVGYTMRVPHSGTPERILNALKWDERVDPLIWQPSPTLFEQADKFGIKVSHIAAKRYSDSGFTRAALRGAIYRGANSTDEIAREAALALRDPGSFAYVYVNDVDEASHSQGFGSAKFNDALDRVNELILKLISELPKGTRIWVTSDHGMINRGDYVIVGKENKLLDDVDLLAGEPRVRYLYLKEEKLEAVRTRWQDSLGEKVKIFSREEAIQLGLFGPSVSAKSKERIGDLVIVAQGDFIIVERERETQQLAMVGHHGGTSKPEIEIPLLTRNI